MRRKYKGRTAAAVAPQFFYVQSARRISVALLSALLQTPALFSSCSTDGATSEAPHQITIEWTKSGTPEALDVFFFDTLGSRNLDSYQQILHPEGSSRIIGISGSGARRMVVLSGKAGETAPWADIHNYGSLCKKTFHIRDDNPDNPALFAEADLADEVSRTVPLPLRPMLSRIRLKSIMCSFAGRPYAGRTFNNTAVYLAFAGTEYRPIGPEGGRPVSWINGGALDSLSTLSLPRPGMILQPGFGEVGIRRIYPGMEFSCYAGSPGGGTPTRLVLVGSVDGHICYYPIELPLLPPASVVELEITLRRMGSSSPEIPAESGAVTVEISTKPWEERSPREILF